MPTSQKAVSIPANFQVESAIASHPHLPKEIIESFSKNPPSEGTTSVLDGYVDLDAPQMSKNITEAKVMPTHSTPMMQSNGIDYSLIKSIIDESVRKYVGALSKKIITESRNANASNLQLFSVGNHLTFVNENGDVYKAQLQYVKNIKENKKTL
jgi:hypothetical protein